MNVRESRTLCVVKQGYLSKWKTSNSKKCNAASLFRDLGFAQALGSCTHGSILSRIRVQAVKEYDIERFYQLCSCCDKHCTISSKPMSASGKMRFSFHELACATSPLAPDFPQRSTQNDPVSNLRAGTPVRSILIDATNENGSPANFDITQYTLFGRHLMKSLNAISMCKTLVLNS